MFNTFQMHMTAKKKNQMPTFAFCLDMAID